MDLVERARLRAVVIGSSGPMQAIAKHLGAESTHDNRVRGLYSVLRAGSPSHEKVLELCSAFQIDPADAGFWFTEDETTWRDIALKSARDHERDSDHERAAV